MKQVSHSLISFFSNKMYKAWALDTWIFHITIQHLNYLYIFIRIINLHN
jgi:hypothetical protein